MSEDIINYVLMSEKAIRFIESENKLVFIVKRDANKKEIKDAVEKAFGMAVKKVNTMIDQKGRKKAFVKFKDPEAAGEIALRLGII